MTQKPAYGTRTVHAVSLFANDVAYEFVNRFGEAQDGYPTGTVQYVCETMLAPEYRTDHMDGRTQVGPLTVTIDGIDFTIISGKLGVEVDG